MSINYSTVLPILCILIAVTCGIFVLSHNKNAKLNQIFSTICLTFSAWFSFYLPFNFSTSESFLVHWFKFSYCFISFIPICCFTFISTYLKIPKNDLFFKINSLIGLLLAVLSLTTNTIVMGSIYYPEHPYPKAGILHPILILHCAFLATWSIKLLLNALKSKTLNQKQSNQTKYMLYGIISLSFGILDFARNYNLPFLEIGPYAVISFLIFTTIAIVKHQLMDIQIVVHKSLIYTLLISCISIIFFLLIFLSEHVFHKLIGYRDFGASIISATVIALIFIPLRNKIQNLVDCYIFNSPTVIIAKENELLRKEAIIADKYKAIATLASGLAHEIKNPLTPLKTFAEHLPHKLDDKAFLLQFSRLITKEVNRIDSLVQEMLEFAKPSQPQLKQVQIHLLINSILALLNNDILKRNIQIHRNFHPYFDKSVRIDARQMKQALLNILLNAIEAMPQGGRISIRTSAEKDHLVISIADTGCGIDPKDMPHIFDPFFTKKDAGTGLGLSITHEIIKNHHGKIFVASKLNEGTTFNIKLPL